MRKPRKSMASSAKELRGMSLRERYHADPIFRANTNFLEGVMASSIEPGDKELPEDGAWIMVLLPPNCEYTVEPLSIYFAVPDTTGPRYKARILCRQGPLWLWPHEYTIIENVSEYITMLGDDGPKINYMSARTELSGDKLFYLRSRGVPYADAVLMLLGEVKDPNFCYLTFPREVQRFFAGTGVMSLFARPQVNAIIDRFEREEAAAT